MSFSEVRDFQNSRADIVARIGALLVSLNGLRDSLIPENSYEVDLSDIRRVQPIVAEFFSGMGLYSNFYTKYHYKTYYTALSVPVSKIQELFSNQTLPSKRKDNVEFLSKFSDAIQSLNEIMIATAQIIFSPVDANIRSTNAFSAYLFFKSIFSSVSKYLCLVDPYIDKTIFSRYLCEISIDVEVVIVTDPKNFKGSRSSEFEDIENLFKIEHQKYVRKMIPSLHDRYLITDTHAYSLGGSIKDAAKKSDYSVVELSESKRIELLKIYA